MSARRAVLYARVSTDTGKQDTESQLRALRALCADRGYSIKRECTDTATGDPRRRGKHPPGLARALALLQNKRAEVLVIWAADRLVRSAGALLDLVGQIESWGASIVSLQDGPLLDTTTHQGQLFVFLRGWFAEMELRIGRERTNAGLARARAQGRRLGRPPRRLSREHRDDVRYYLARGYSERSTASILGHTRRQVIQVATWIKNGGVETDWNPEGEESP